MKVLIVDDEQLARQRLRHMLNNIDDFECIGEAENGHQALERIKVCQPDIVLMDIRMPKMDGMQAAQMIANSDDLACRVIFTTAYDDHALDAFAAQASGYLLKPINKGKLQQALQQAARIDLSEKPSARQHLSSSTGGKIELIALSDVRLLMAEHKYVTVYHCHGEAILDESLKSLEQEFATTFVRIHRNALVSIKHIQALDKIAAGQYQMSIADTELKPTVSRRLITDIRKLMKKL